MGKLKKPIKVLFSLLTMLVLVSPVIKLFNEDFSFDSVIETDEIKIDKTFNEYAQMVREGIIENDVKNALKDNDIYCEAVDCVFSDSDCTKIESILINLDDLVIIEKEWHIYKNEVLKKVATLLEIDERRVQVIE